MVYILVAFSMKVVQVFKMCKVCKVRQVCKVFSVSWFQGVKSSQFLVVASWKNADNAKP